MRADRLLAMLMLLQTRGQLTARQLAAELEVSERTIYRDVTALSASGVPIYTEGGPGGGIALLEEYHTSLTGLNADEVQALSMLNIPEPLVRLGVAPNLKAALLKLSAAMPDSTRQAEAHTRQRIHLDTRGWFEAEESTPHLQTIQQAVWQENLIELTFRGDFETVLTQTVSPYGLVAKANAWHLVAERNTHLSVIRVARITTVRLLDQTFIRPTDFDLTAFWQTWCANFEASRPHYTVTARISPMLARHLPGLLKNKPVQLNTPPPQSSDGWQTVTLSFESFEDARTRILGLGNAIEVREPLALRLSVMDYAEQISIVYRSTS